MKQFALTVLCLVCVVSIGVMFSGSIIQGAIGFIIAVPSGIGAYRLNYELDPANRGPRK